ncbi:MAG: hypothetical protein MUO26_10890 [Methanotrichaceae archaeon]|nr:hypothetical protein [Methanotrichaceae archaeon]
MAGQAFSSIYPLSILDYYVLLNPLFLSPALLTCDVGDQDAREIASDKKHLETL